MRTKCLRGGLAFALDEPQRREGDSEEEGITGADNCVKAEGKIIMNGAKKNDGVRGIFVIHPPAT